MTSTEPSTKRKALHFDVFEVVLICVLVAVASAVAARHRPDHPETKPFTERYGPHHFSEGVEEWLIRDYFADRRDGFFVDVGANHHERLSKTYFLETKLGWSGIAVEPQKEFAQGYAEHRPRTRFLPFFVSDVSNEQARIYVLKSNTAVTSGNKAFVERYGTDPEEVIATSITLNDLLTAERVNRIDFLSIDIELWEPKALAGFDIDRFKPEMVCIEALPEVRQFIFDYFARHHYVILGKYLRADDQNVYFARLPPAG